MKVMVMMRRGGSAQHVLLDAPASATRGEARREVHQAVCGEVCPPVSGGVCGGVACQVDGDPADGGSVGDDDLPLLQGADLDAVPGAGPGTRAHPWLVVASGPDAGATAALPPGRWVTVGRDPLCHLTIHDPDLSRRHVRVRHDRDGVRVEDLGSTNGVVWELPGTSDLWRAQDRLVVGGSCLALVPRALPRASTAISAGRVDLTPWPRVVPRLAPVQLARPSLPQPRAVRRPSAWTWTLPLGIALLVAVVLRMPWLLLFGLLGPAMVLGHHLADRRAAREEHAEALQVFAEGCARAEAEAELAAREELLARRALDPGLLGVVTALQPYVTTRLWDGCDEPVRVVLGEGDETSSVTLDGAAEGLARAPVTHDLSEPVAVLGRPPDRDALLRSLVLQVACRHPPSQVHLVVDPDDPLPGGVDVLAWLPHTRSGGGAGRGQAAGPGAHRLVWGVDVVPTDDPRRVPATMTRVHVVGPDLAVLQRPGHPDRSFRPSLLSLPRARHLARALAPLRPVLPVGPGHPDGPGGPGGPAGSSHPGSPRPAGGPLAAGVVPPPAPLGRLMPWPLSPAAVVTGWRASGLEVPLGVRPDGSALLVDLARDGPHALVAGTTGSGKSELLRTLVTALALRCSPEELSLLLIDYKGGSALGDCAALPHVTGLVTDLDPHLAERVLVSLQAELTRREGVLQASGARDIQTYQGAGLPRLVVVVDEFRVLAEEVPEVLSGLVRVAAVGRSLGVHLVLATQRPAGVVSADLRANVNLRIALRVRDVADSHDVLECADAAALPEGQPGVALLRTGSDPPRLVRVATAEPAAGDRPAQTRWSVQRYPDAWSARQALEKPDPGGDRSGLEAIPALAEVVTRAADERGARAVAVWVPPLPDRLTTLGTDPAAWAVTDRPDQQNRVPLVWTGRQHLGIVGAARTGRSTAVRSLLQRAGPCWWVALDLGRGLWPPDPDGQERPEPQERNEEEERAGWPQRPEDHPGCLAWAGPDESAHGLRVLDLLLQEVMARQADPRRPADRVLVVLDGWDRMVDVFGEVERGRGLEVAQRLLREGPGVGVVAIVTGDRSLLVGRLATLLPETWALRLNDPSDLMLAGLHPRQVPREQPPGRVVGARDGVIAQVVLPDAGTLPPAPEGPAPFRCRPLPRRWAVDPMVDPLEADSAVAGGPDADGPPTARHHLTWAVGGDEATPVPAPKGSVLVLGPPGSGRTHTLHALAQARGRAALTIDGTDPPSEHELQARTGRLERGDLVLLDDAHLLAGTPAEEAVLSVAARQGVDLLAAADLDTAASAFRGVVPHIARSRTAVVLQPTAPTQGAVVGASLPVGDLPVPGRGVLVHRGRCTRVQVRAP